MSIIHRPGSLTGKARLTLAGAARRLRDTAAARRYDLVVVHRESLPLGPAWVESILRTLGVPYVFDFDDAIYLGDTSTANRHLGWLTAPGKTITVISGASGVLAGNEHLARWASAHNHRVTVIPTAIDTDRYQPVSMRDQDPVCIGWTGSMSTIPHLELIAPVLRELQLEEQVRIRVIGDPQFQISGAKVESLPWRRESELEDLSQIDIGVMPLPDDEWGRGKCGFKALQYMGIGIPAVLSPVGVNVAIAQDGAAILASTAEEWKGSLRSLIADPALRAELGAAGRRRVEEAYSVQVVLPQLERALRAAADNGR
jgi:glycosyltransferase involved in cell wall biosynthesis